MLRVGVGVAEKGEGSRMGAEAARRALAGLGGLKPSAAVLLAGFHRLDHHALLAGVRSILGPVPLAGGTTFGELAGPKRFEGSAVVWLLAGEKIRASTGLGLGMAIDSFAAGAEAARQALAGLNRGAPRLFVVFYETQMGHPHLAIEGAKSVLGRNFPIAGAGTGTGMIMEQSPFSKQFRDAEVLGGCLAGLLLSGDFAFSCAFSHGGVAVSPEFEITRTRDNIIHELGGRPALDVFEEALELKLGARGLSYLDVHLALPEANHPGVETVRALWGFCPNARTLYCGNRIDAGVPGRFIQVRGETTLSRQKESLEAARRALGGPPAGALVIDCYGRKLTLGAKDLLDREVELIDAALGLVPSAGLYSGSETAVLGWGGAGPESRYSHQSTSIVLFRDDRA